MHQGEGMNFSPSKSERTQTSTPAVSEGLASANDAGRPSEQRTKAVDAGIWRRIPQSELTAAIDSSLLDWREGRRSIGSAFRLRCGECHQLIDRGLEIGSPCPLYVGPQSKCTGKLEANPTYRP